MNNQHGFSLVGLMLAIVVIAALAYGSVFFWQKTSEQTSLEAYNQAEKQIEDIKKIVDERNEKIVNQIEEVPVIEDISEWQEYEKEEFDIKLNFHKDWYYQRENKASEWGYKLYIGFAPSPTELAKGKPYPVEVIIISAEDEDSGYYEKKKEREDDVVIIRTTKTDDIEIKSIVDAMFSSLVAQESQEVVDTSINLKTNTYRESDYVFNYPAYFTAMKSDLVKKTTEFRDKEKDCKLNIEFCSNPTPAFSFSVIENSTNDLIEIVKENNKESGYPDEAYKNVKVNNIDFIKLEVREMYSSDSYYFAGNENVAWLTFYNKKDGLTQEEIDNILESIKIN